MRFARVGGITAAALLASSAGVYAQQTTLTIATVNNGDMIVMQKLSPKFEQETGIKLNWVVLEENVLRQRVTTDIATKGGSFDVVTISGYETPIWGKQGWLTPVDDLGQDYDYNDIVPQVKSALTVDGKMYSAPFYAESSLVFYRKDLFDKAGIKMADKPTYEQIAQYADKLNDKSGGIYGICLRGKPGWGENMAFLGTAAVANGGEWFNEKWQPQFTSKPWENTVKWYLDVMKKDGPPGATANGYNENRALFATGKCGMWIDATVTAGYLYNPKESQVADKVAFAPAPVTAANEKASGWFWTWALGIPASSKQADAAKKFVKWATSKDYIKMVGESEGWVSAPPGTRLSTYASADYKKAAPFADFVLNAIKATDPTKPTVNPVPYTGVQYASIPEFQGIGTTAGQDIAAALAGQSTGEEALKKAQTSAERTLKQAGYPK
ncbi:sugar ABC transporter substrate-binding protein [Lichenihabitans sp. Uapishka_5]|uniref:ABC transporter substrate-binding protein n=1 Tax=Lichenihabitans sp. Uapishka_5 TaxID=3037302 RepID=UPI0029E7EF4D|nr:sugar ABC transporter substrate-binding protein [Lichenihabitans sp. Uapishka_5]MDX7950052.1 sugar ABC transporter substrate-binding protein [Lichenihabitans sp. Uapishka_5]